MEKAVLEKEIKWLQVLLAEEQRKCANLSKSISDAVCKCPELHDASLFLFSSYIMINLNLAFSN